jgi:primosomal protein N' (replication factor Y)
MEEVVTRGEQVLFLLPEIALTSQIAQRMKTYFGDIAISFHSRYSQNERVELWKKVSNGAAKVIIGPRSAVFLPFKNLGLVVVDEEHESSYKQMEPAPRYHARDAAIYLAHLRGCKTLLGSATPSYESYSNAHSNRYGLVELKNRFGDLDTPEIVTADLAEESRVKTMKGPFTSQLASAIANALEHQEQIILFQNRRGFAPVLECQECHWVPKCKNCDISLTYHKFIDSMKCHYCGFTRNMPKSCEACSGVLLNLKGLGTEKIEDELGLYFPEARVMRLDLDAAKTKHGTEQIIQSFSAHEADILVGTQMVSKGLDFEKVSLVGIVNADQLLYFPDFRANERAYQLISQVSGRAGRKHKKGHVIVQSSTPYHKVIQEAIHQKYETLYKDEMAERRMHAYPPYFRLIKLVIRHKDPKVNIAAANYLRQSLYTKLGDKVAGPASPYVPRIRNLFIQELLIKLERNEPLLNAMKGFIMDCIRSTLTQNEFKRVSIFADVDPM